MVNDKKQGLRKEEKFQSVQINKQMQLLQLCVEGSKYMFTTGVKNYVKVVIGTSNDLRCRIYGNLLIMFGYK